MSRNLLHAVDSMSDRVFAVDLEGVIADIHSYYIDEHNDLYDGSVSLDDDWINSWHWPGRMVGGLDGFLRITHKGWNEDADRIKLVDQEISELMERFDNYYDVDIVTHRTGCDEAIREWLASNDIAYRNLVVVPGSNPKPNRREYTDFVDDKDTIVHQVHDDQHAHLVARPWNEQYRGQAIDQDNSTVVESLRAVAEEAIEEYRTCVVVIGYPGAGKSLAGDILADAFPSSVLIESGDVVRRGAREHFDVEDTDDIDSDVLADYSTMRRNRDGGDYVAQDVISQLEADEDFPRGTAIVSGMRDSEFPPVFDEFFDRYEIWWIQADFSVRLDRLRGRGRQNEAEFTAADLLNRDLNECNEWGLGELTRGSDRSVRNNGSIDEFRSDLIAATEVFNTGDR